MNISQRNFSVIDSEPKCDVRKNSIVVTNPVRLNFGIELDHQNMHEDFDNFAQKKITQLSCSIVLGAIAPNLKHIQNLFVVLERSILQ